MQGSLPKLAGVRMGKLELEPMARSEREGPGQRPSFVHRELGRIDRPACPAPASASSARAPNHALALSSACGTAVGRTLCLTHPARRGNVKLAQPMSALCQNSGHACQRDLGFGASIRWREPWMATAFPCGDACCSRL